MGEPPHGFSRGLPTNHEQKPIGLRKMTPHPYIALHPDRLPKSANERLIAADSNEATADRVRHTDYPVHHTGITTGLP